MATTETPEEAPETSSRPRVLFVGVGEPGRGGAGYLVRERMLLDALDQCADVQLALFDVPPELTTIGRWSVTALALPGHHEETWLEARCNDLFSAKPMMLRWKDCGSARGRIAALHPESFDAIVAYRIDFAFFAGVIDQPHLIIDIDDPEHVRRRDRLRTIGRGVADWYAWLDLHRLRRFERRAARKAVAAFVCQERDQQAFPPPRPLIVPNVVEAPAECPARRAERPAITFVGNLTGNSQSPNVDGLTWFVEKAWPEIARRQLDCRLRIVGPISESWRNRFSSVRGVVVEGFVPSMPEALAASSLTIAPIRFGTGTRIKILESMAWGCPVVSTTKGLEGIEAVAGRDIVVADSPASFAEQCLRLLVDKEEQSRLAIAGHALIRACYDRSALQPRLVEQFRRLIETARNRRINAR